MSNKYLDTKHFELLDGLRGLSILAVVWHHSSGELPFYANFFLHGYLGVDFFFILSGFLITFLLIKERAATGVVSLKKFYIRRSLRIFPLYYTYLILLTILLIFKDPARIEEIFDNFKYYFFYLSNFIPSDNPGQYFHRSWSLAVEEQFYLFWPLAFILLPRASLKLFVGAAILIISVLDCLTPNIIQGGYVDLLVPFRAILLGCFLSLMLAESNMHRLFHKFLSGQYSIAFAVLTFFCVVLISGAELSGLEYIFVHLAAVSVIACAVLNESNKLASCLKWKPLQLIGVVSYGIYILHSQFWGITDSIVKIIPVNIVSESKITFFCVFTIVSLLAAVMSYKYYESFFLGLKKKYVS